MNKQDERTAISTKLLLVSALFSETFIGGRRYQVPHIACYGHIDKDIQVVDSGTASLTNYKLLSYMCAIESDLPWQQN